MMWVKSKVNGKELIYIHVPRTGGSSMMYSMSDHSQLDIVCEHRPHMTLHDMEKAHPFGDVPVFASIRNPFPWLVSQWGLVQHPRHANGGHPFYDVWPDFKTYAFMHARHYRPWRFQSDFVNNSTPEDLRLYPFERLPDMWGDIETELGIKLERAHINRASLNYWRDMYDDQLLYHVREVFACDFDLYEKAGGIAERVD